MAEVLLQVLPLNIASALSPALFAMSIFLLGSKEKPKLKVLTLLAGSVLVGIAAVIIGLLLGNPDPDEQSEKIIAAVINIILGCALLFFAVRIITAKEGRFDIRKISDPKYWHLFIAGIIVNATNFDAVIISMTAAKEAYESPDIDIIEKLLLLAVNILFFTLPIWLPLVFYMIAPKSAKPVLDKMNGIVVKYGKYLVLLILVIIGGILLYEGISYFL